MRILIAEDDFVSRKLMQRILSPYGECSLASNGKQAVSLYIEALKIQEPFKLAFMDIMMPIMDGHEALAVIRESERRRNIAPEARLKVLMTTALADHDNVTQAMKNQCHGYLVKPINNKQLIEKLYELDLIELTENENTNS